MENDLRADERPNVGVDRVFNQRALIGIPSADDIVVERDNFGGGCGSVFVGGRGRPRGGRGEPEPARVGWAVGNPHRRKQKTNCQYRRSSYSLFSPLNIERFCDPSTQSDMETACTYRPGLSLDLNVKPRIKYLGRKIRKNNTPTVTTAIAMRKVCGERGYVGNPAACPRFSKKRMLFGCVNGELQAVTLHCPPAAGSC
jgi:hypothetical protein